MSLDMHKARKGKGKLSLRVEMLEAELAKRREDAASLETENELLRYALGHSLRDGLWAER